MYPAFPPIHYKLNQKIERVPNYRRHALMSKSLPVHVAAPFQKKTPAGAAAAAAAVTRASQSWMPPSLSIECVRDVSKAAPLFLLDGQPL